MFCFPSLNFLSLTSKHKTLRKEKAEAEMNYDYQLIQTVGLDTAEGFDVCSAGSSNGS